MLLYWLWLSLLPDISLRKKLGLIEHFSDPESVYKAPKLPDGSQPDRDLTRARAVLEECRRKGIGILGFTEPAYPARLRNISDPPLVLYYKGVLPDFDSQPAIGVVGTRRATTYGKTIARRISGQIAASGGLVVSGGAAGVDAQALLGALDACCPCVAVLGCGVDVVYPAENRSLFRDIEKKGCLMSEYPPGTRGSSWRFPARNRIISGMSNGILVVEAPQRSGALITARNALEQGRDIFAVPGNIDMETCSGSNGLLQEGASAALSGWDVMRVYAPQYPGVEKCSVPKITAQPVCDKKDIDIPDAKPYSGKETAAPSLTEEEARLLALLGPAARPVDAVIAEAGLPAATVLRMLTKLALQGVVVNHPGKLVSRK